MKIWEKINILQSFLPDQRAALQVSRRWAEAARRNRALAGDVIRIGGVLVLQPLEAGELAPTDPYRLAYEAGRRDLALQLLAMMNLTIDELNQLTEDNDA